MLKIQKLIEEYEFDLRDAQYELDRMNANREHKDTIFEQETKIKILRQELLGLYDLHTQLEKGNA